MNRQAAMQTQQAEKATSAPSGILQRQCACGNHAAGGECEECKQKRESTLQRAAINSSLVHDVPPVVHQVLRSPGQPLDAATRAFMEPRFGHDFSHVRVHTDAQAAQSAQAVSALAFTVGQDVVFGAGQYAPQTSEGRQLMAHELTHVAQQAGKTRRSVAVGMLGDQREQEADRAAQTVVQGEQQVVRTKANTGPVLLQRKPQGEMQQTRAKRDSTRRDLVQGTSWVNLYATDGHVASIYFATNESKLDAQDMRVLSKVYNAYQKHLGLGKVTLLFVGYADYRGTESDNLSLGRRRAEAVSEYFSPLASSPNYSWGIASAGETELPQIGTTSKELSLYRRVDIKASPIIKKPQSDNRHEPKPKPEPRSILWKCRIQGSASGGIGYGGSFFGLEIVDLTNFLRMYYSYRGGALKLAPGLTVGWSGGNPGTDWQMFTTSIPIRIQDFTGPARHTSAGVQIGRGPSFETIQLFGPSIHNADSVYLGWYGLWEKGGGIGAGTDIGRLQPEAGPDFVGVVHELHEVQ